MRRIHLLILSLFTLCMAPQQAPAQGVDPASGPVHPYNAGDERSRFLAAVGLDNELSAEEFQADQAKGNNFARSFDSWPALLKYDANKNKKISWIEADAYRMDLSREAIKVYDADGDRKIRGEEQSKLNAALAGGQLPGKFSQQAKPEKPSKGRNPAKKPKTDSGQTQPGQGEQPGNDDNARQSRRQRLQEMRKKMLERLDTDGDGEVSRQERRAWAEKMRQEREKQRLEKYDTDRDGQLSQAERDAEMQQRRQEMMQRIRTGLERRFDADKDGHLSPEEAAKVQEEYDRIQQRIQATIDARRTAEQERVRRFDSDGDGELSGQEREIMNQTLQEERQKAWELFSAKADSDGDGNASRQERRDYFRKLTQTYDADGNGRLSSEEWKTLAEKEGFDPRRLSGSRGRRAGRNRSRDD